MIQLKNYFLLCSILNIFARSDTVRAIKKINNRRKINLDDTSNLQNLSLPPSMAHTLDFYITQVLHQSNYDPNKICSIVCNKKADTCTFWQQNWDLNNRQEQIRYKKFMISREKKFKNMQQFLLPLPYIRNSTDARFDIQVSCHNCSNNTEGSMCQTL